MNQSLIFLVVIGALLGVLAYMYLGGSREKKMEIRPSGLGGRGVFAMRDIAAGETIEECPAIVIPTEELGDTTLDYVFGLDEERNVLPFGYGAMYNHHPESPNVDYQIAEDGSFMVFLANRDIRKGEEMLVTYGPTWFEERGMVARI